MPCSNDQFEIGKSTPKILLLDMLLMRSSGILHIITNCRSSGKRLLTVLHAQRLEGRLGGRLYHVVRLSQSSLQIQLRNLAIGRTGRGLRERQELNMAVVYAKYRSAGRTSAGYLILSDSTPKNKLYSSVYIRISIYHHPRIFDHDDLIALI